MAPCAASRTLGPAPTAENPGPLRHLLEEMLQRMVEPGGVRQLTPVSFRRGIAELARSSMRRIVGIDLGAHYLTWVTADEAGAAESRVFADGGLAARSLVAPGGASRLSRMLPLAIDEMAVADALRNLHARPGTIPQTDDELAVIHAAARYLLARRRVTREASRVWTCWSAAAAPSPPLRGRRRRPSSCSTACGRWASPSSRSTVPGRCPHRRAG